jgi:hypothetical protein
MLLAAICMVSVAACADPEKEQLKKTTIPTYDKAGKLTELTYDFNKNGKIDTWAQMDGARPVLTRMDRNEDGRMDRWEYFDAQGELEKVGLSRRDDGKPDEWVYQGKDGNVERIEISSMSDPARIDRWEHYDATGLVAAEEDTNADAKIDKWETFVNGAVRTAAFDENKDGRPDRRLTYDGARLVTIESEPDASGHFAKRVEVKQ